MFGRKDKTIIDGGDGSSSAAACIAAAAKDLASPETVDVNGTCGSGGGGSGGGGSGGGLSLPNGGSTNNATSSAMNADGLIDPKKLGTRVFKKSSPNGKITT